MSTRLVSPSNSGLAVRTPLKDITPVTPQTTSLTALVTANTAFRGGTRKFKSPLPLGSHVKNEVTLKRKPQTELRSPPPKRARVVQSNLRAPSDRENQPPQTKSLLLIKPEPSATEDQPPEQHQPPQLRQRPRPLPPPSPPRVTCVVAPNPVLGLGPVWLGGARAASNGAWLKGAQIRAILNVAAEIPNYYEGGEGFEEVRYLRLEAKDTADQPLLPAFPSALHFITTGRAQGGAVLIHCQLGQSRSVTVLAAYLLAHENLSLRQVRRYLAALAVPLGKINPGFHAQLVAWEVQQRGATSEGRKRRSTVRYKGAHPPMRQLRLTPLTPVEAQRADEKERELEAEKRKQKRQLRLRLSDSESSDGMVQQRLDTLLGGKEKEKEEEEEKGETQGKDENEGST